jgi:hypothetical protein
MKPPKATQQKGSQRPGCRQRWLHHPDTVLTNIRRLGFAMMARTLPPALRAVRTLTARQSGSATSESLNLSMWSDHAVAKPSDGETYVTNILFSIYFYGSQFNAQTFDMDTYLCGHGRIHGLQSRLNANELNRIYQLGTTISPRKARRHIHVGNN